MLKFLQTMILDMMPLLPVITVIKGIIQVNVEILLQTIKKLAVNRDILLIKLKKTKTKKKQKKTWSAILKVGTAIQLSPLN